ncbi:hypothetical protein O7626_29505 [Micromonospora sp. WMMD1102]|uniref:hypothetical protein n=1 Tax=Micromonospora sp. WMMD1102 TaxID=3016105 RepID=UPI0024157128|nr:hypothetical protein [Micromonospora sp. WMMD1102]MDG4790011.1 hypothetical protein [Micromonospora sp. WMMD1102]
MNFTESECPMSWFRTARRGAADEFGRRFWRWFLAAAIIRRTLPTLLILVAVAAAVAVAARSAVWWLPRLTGLAVTAAVLGLIVWLWRRWRWQMHAGQHRAAAVATACLAVIGVLGTALYWLR